MRFAPGTIILKTRSEVKVTVTRKRYAALRHPKMHPHSYLKEYRIYAPDTKRAGGLAGGWTDGRTGGQCDYYMPPKVPLGAKN